MYTGSRFGLGTWEEDLIIEEVTALVSQEERHLIFIFNMHVLYF